VDAFTTIKKDMAIRKKPDLVVLTDINATDATLKRLIKGI